MKRLAYLGGVASLLASTALVLGQPRGNPFIDHSDTGEIIHVLPPPAAVRSPHDTAPTFAPPFPGLSVYPPSYGSGNLKWHGGPQIPNAGFFAIYWNDSVANSTATSLGYATLQSQIAAFAAAFADGINYSQSDPGADYTVIQQYGKSQAISSAPLSPVLSSLGYFVDSRPTQSKISDSQIRSYLASLFQNQLVPASANVVYGVYFPPGMRITIQGGSSCTSFCGYHGRFTYNGTDIKYASFPYANCSGCKLSNLSVADMLTIVTSHEIREAVTDPDLNAWYDAAGYEADDKCAWHNLYQMQNGGFWVQPEFSNGGTVTDASGYTATYPQLPNGQGGCVVAK